MCDQAWFLDLSAEEQAAVVNVVTKLEISGVALGRPHTAHLMGTKDPLGELRRAWIASRGDSR